jgi:ethanolamine utilization protein EutS
MLSQLNRLPPLPIMNLPGMEAIVAQDEQELTRIIQEYVPGKQVTIAHVIAHPDSALSQRVGLEGVEAIGIMTLTPGESAIIAGDLAMKAAAIDIGFLDRFSGTLVVTGSLSNVETALEAANQGLESILGFHPARVTRR